MEQLDGIIENDDEQDQNQEKLLNLVILESMKDLSEKNIVELTNYSNLLKIHAEYISNNILKIEEKINEEISSYANKYDCVIYKVDIQKENLNLNNCNIQTVSSNMISNIEKELSYVNKLTNRIKESVEKVQQASESIKSLQDNYVPNNYNNINSIPDEEDEEDEEEENYDINSFGGDISNEFLLLKRNRDENTPKEEENVINLTNIPQNSNNNINNIGNNGSKSPSKEKATNMRKRERVIKALKEKFPEWSHKFSFNFVSNLLTIKPYENTIMPKVEKIIYQRNKDFSYVKLISNFDAVNEPNVDLKLINFIKNHFTYYIIHKDEKSRKITAAGELKRQVKFEQFVNNINNENLSKYGVSSLTLQCYNFFPELVVNMKAQPGVVFETNVCDAFIKFYEEEYKKIEEIRNEFLRLNSEKQIINKKN